MRFLLIIGILCIISVSVIGFSQGEYNASNIYIIHDTYVAKTKYSAFPVFINGILIGGIEKDQYFQYQTTLSRISVGCISSTLSYSGLMLDLTPGENYYVRIRFKAGLVSNSTEITLLSSEEGADKVKTFTKVDLMCQTNKTRKGLLHENMSGL